MSSSVFDSIITLLADHEVAYRHIRHEPVHTSEEAAVARGEPLEIGGKALVIKVDADFTLFVLSAPARLDGRAVKRHFSAKRMRFASTGELKDLTSLVPGSVPPFGKPILPLSLYVDPSVFGNKWIAFNAGSLEDSLVMPTAAYRRIARPEVFEFGEKTQRKTTLNKTYQVDL